MWAGRPRPGRRRPARRGGAPPPEPARARRRLRSGACRRGARAGPGRRPGHSRRCRRGPAVGSAPAGVTRTAKLLAVCVTRRLSTPERADLQRAPRAVDRSEGGRGEAGFTEQAVEPPGQPHRRDDAHATRRVELIPQVVAKRDEVDEVVGVQVADDDPHQVRGLQPAGEAGERALAEVQAKRRARPATPRGTTTPCPGGPDTQRPTRRRSTPSRGELAGPAARARRERGRSPPRRARSPAAISQPLPGPRVAAWPPAEGKLVEAGGRGGAAYAWPRP